MRNTDPASRSDRQADEQGETPADLIPYSKAKALLTEQFPDTTTEEIAMWVFLEPPEDYEPNRDIDPDYPPGFEDYPVEGPVYGGLISYYRCGNDKARASHIYSRAIVGENIEWAEIKQNLQLRSFSRAEIKAFTPPDRWISFSELELRWSKIIGEDDAAALIETKLDIDASGILQELTMGYPVTNIHKTKEMCMYSMSEIELIEKKEYLAEISQVQAGLNPTASITQQTIDRNEVIDAFPVKRDPDDNRKFWDDKLGRPPDWLLEALRQKGKPGISSRWDPLLIAHSLLDKNYMSLRQLDTAIGKSFSEMFDQWKEETEDQRNQ